MFQRRSYQRKKQILKLLRFPMKKQLLNNRKEVIKNDCMGLMMSKLLTSIEINRFGSRDPN